eukprot:1216674-Amphidinium_carterae.1
MAPDVFGHIHKDTHRRWEYGAQKPKSASKKKKKKKKKKKVTDMQITELTAMAHSLLQQGA